MRNVILMMIVLMPVLAVNAADTWWVDNGLSDYEGHTGKSETLAFRTIQEAVDVARDDDTILVKPGDYNEGEIYAKSQTVPNSDTASKNRVVLYKRLTLKSTNGAGVTSIVGQHSADPTYGGCGSTSEAVRCIYVTYEGRTSKIEGFTICNGATQYDDQGGQNCGGGVYYNGQFGADIVDCVITNCVGTRGAAAHGVRLFRTLIADNVAPGSGTKSILRRCHLYNCIMTRNHSVAYLCDYPFDTINSTIYENYYVNAMFQAQSCQVLNSLVLTGCQGGSNKIGSPNETYYTNCVVNSTNGVPTPVRTNWDATRFQLKTSVVGGDMRLAPDSLAIGQGDVAFVDLIPEEYRDKDFYGNPRTTNGSVNCGAVQSVADCGEGVVWFRFEAKDKISGASYRKWDYVHPDTTPTMLKIAAVVPATSNLYQYTMSSAYSATHFPDMDGNVGVYVPATGVVDVKSVFADAVRYVDANVSVEAEQDGSAAKPFRTIQQAINVSGIGPTNTLINVAAGTYAEGYTDFHGRTRVKIDRHVYIRGAGADSTVIKGEADPDVALASTPFGCGPKAVRCVANLNITSAVQGFTLADGHANKEETGSSYAIHRGGCYIDVLADGSNAANNLGQVLDCIITNGVASRGSAVSNGRTFRTLITGCRATSNGNTQNSAKMFGCVLQDNLNGDTIGNGAYAYNCTIFQPNGQIKNPYGYTMNSVVYPNGGRAPNQEDRHCKGSIYWKVKDMPELGDYKVMDPCFVNDGKRDFRSTSLTQILGQGSVEAIDPTMMSLGYDGYPVIFKEGNPTPGAYQSLVPAVVVNVAGGDVTVDGGKVGTNILANVDSRITVSVVDNDRRFNHFEFAGQTSTDTSWTSPVFAGGVVFENLGALNVVFDQDYYVDANNGNDDANGLTPETARKSLSAIFAIAKYRGDVVHAADGDYDTENSKVLTPGASYTYTVASVPEGVTLKSINGYENAFITGADAPAETADEAGCGKGATRCVFLADGAKVSGFTLRNGRVGIVDASSTRDHNGGAVQGVGVDKCFVEDCYIINNRGVRGGSINSVTANRCKFTRNICWRYGSVGYTVKLINCIAWENDGMHVTQDDEVHGCTFGYGNYTKGDTTWTTSTTMGKSNVSCPNAKRTISNPDITNCIILDGRFYENNYSVGSVWCSTIKPVDEERMPGCKFASAEEINLDSDYMPNKGSVAIGAGSMDEIILARLGLLDVNGVQRIYNGRIDAGACEYDCRPDYANDLGKASYLTVASASPEIIEQERSVFMPSGAMVVEVDNRKSGGSLNAVWSVTGNGKLTVMKGDEVVDEYVNGTYSPRIDIDTTGKTVLTFKYEAGENDVGGAWLNALARNSGLVIIVR